MDCINCGDGYPAIIEGLCADCINDREYERIEKEQARRGSGGWDEDDWS